MKLSIPPQKDNVYFIERINMYDVRGPYNKSKEFNFYGFFLFKLCTIL